MSPSSSSPPSILSTSPNNDKIPILLLKTRSTPNDGYEEQFSKSAPSSTDPDSDGQCLNFTPTFVPVLEHQLNDDGMTVVRELLRKREIGYGEGCKYGGMIFTSQRAVEAFALLVEEGRKDDPSFPHLHQTPLYTVGPATSRALLSIPTTPPLNIHGSQTGNGEALAHFILEHYPTLFPSITIPTSPSAPTSTTKPPTPLIFLVGDARRDIIPKTLMSPSLPPHQRIQVDEIVVYGTGVMESFESSFEKVLVETRGRKVRWVVVFSPTGCESMLRALGMLDRSTGRVKAGCERRENREGGDGVGIGKKEGKTYIATIGPTTRDYLREKFGYEPDVCAEKPSPEGVEEGIAKFMSSL